MGLDGMTVEERPSLYSIVMSLDADEFGNTGDLAPAAVNPPGDGDLSSRTADAPAEVFLMTSYRKLVKNTTTGHFKIEMFCAKKKQGEFGVEMAEIKSMPMHKKSFDVSLKGNIRIKGFVQLLIVGEPMSTLKTDWVYEEKAVQEDEDN